MLRRLRHLVEGLYERLLLAELSETPSHVAVIQDGNRRFASERDDEATEGHRAGAHTTEQLLGWCDELDIEELTLYAFSTENFERSAAEREALFDLIAEKLREFADHDRVHAAGLQIRAIGETDRLPARVRAAIDYAEDRTADYEGKRLNVALAYGGRAELRGAAREIASDVRDGTVDPDEVDIETVESALPAGPTRDVDLIIRSGGDERTSNFLPWQANGNEAAVFFSAPYWPAFRKIDFLRGIRTYEHREETWRQSRIERARALVSVLGPDSEASRTLEAFEDPEGHRSLREGEDLVADAAD